MTYQPPSSDPTHPVPYTPGPEVEQPISSSGAHAPPVPKTRGLLTWLAGGAAAVVILSIGIGIGANLDNGQTVQPGAAAASTPTAKPATPAPTATTAAPTPTKTTAAPKPTKVTYRPLSERQWKLVAKNPDNYIGKTYIVYGVVSQFDAATGTNAFLANVAGKNLAEDYEYDTNTMLSGDAGKLTNLVEDDEFRATVRVIGSHSYDTQIGGNTTVPLLAIASIKIL
ncbi:hypothetical protein [Plantactinospora soyae]|uniref:Uncharacterized protein n=1 Tax=Plantactinospora soyae TaxID=1544732 RepID=A0A927M0W1_9ACTN|nr:hypothetical protein [Plantactinospora soyae]MBE1484661.1 hypothetical protein [Plantactinospora soyae]